ncbi:MAG: hypothetical protein QW238_05700 [Candidatus Bathyarchaeia archaeon]
MMELALLLIGLVVAAISSMVGLWGRVFYMPLLARLHSSNSEGGGLKPPSHKLHDDVRDHRIRRGRRRSTVEQGMLLDTLDVPRAVVVALLTTIISS